jgi:glycosyltransferase involved in cell wall biosynthesis
MLTLGLIVRDEEEMLRRTLPVVAPWFRHKVMLNTGSTDNTHLVAAAYALSGYEFKWVNDFSVARNRLLDIAVCVGEANWLLQLDADEAMFPCDIIALDRLCTTVTEDVIALPRINLADHGRLVCTDNSPDWQARCVRLGSSARWELPVHEVIKAAQYQAGGLPIYHYGFCKPPRSCWLRSHNYERIAAGEPTLTAAPDWVSNDPAQWLADMRQRHTFESYDEMHPLRGLI